MSELAGINSKFSTINAPPRDDRGDMYVFNTSGEEIPGYAPMLLADSVTGLFRNVIKPNADSIDSFRIMFNGPSPIPIGKDGIATSGFEILTQLTGTPSTGDDIGTLANSWFLSTTTTGFKFRGWGGGLAYASPFLDSGAGGIQSVALKRDSTGSISIDANPIGASATVYSSWDDFSVATNIHDELSSLATNEINLTIATADGEIAATGSLTAVNLGFPVLSTNVFFDIQLKDIDGNIYSPTGAGYNSTTGLSILTSLVALGQCNAVGALALTYTLPSAIITSWRYRVINNLTTEPRVIADSLNTDTGATFMFIGAESYE